MRITGESNKGQCGGVYGTVKGMNGGLVMDDEVFMSVPLMLIDVVAQMAKDARGKGAAEAPAGESVEEPLVKRFWESLKGVGTEEREEKKAHKVVHLLKNQPPLPSKVVEKIKEGSFVDFAFFPVFDDGPGEAGDWRASQGESGESTAAGSAGRRRSVKEVPDLAGWGTCFTLFQVAWASSKPEMWVPLSAYREVIVKLAKRHQWTQVARYDRRFRQEAAGRAEVNWEEENLSLLLDIVHATPPGKPEPKQAAGVIGTPPRRLEQRRRGSCFRYNRGEGRCNFGAQCRFAHVCSDCGGDHPAFHCAKPGVNIKN